MARGPGRYDEILQTFGRHIAAVGYDGTNFGAVAAELGPVEAGLDTLLVFGAAQWAWTWFRPDGSDSAQQVGSALVDLCSAASLSTGGRVVALAGADSPIIQVVRAVIRDAPVELKRKAS
jgi:hypothetical protein